MLKVDGLKKKKKISAWPEMPSGVTFIKGEGLFQALLFLLLLNSRVVSDEFLFDIFKKIVYEGNKLL